MTDRLPVALDLTGRLVVVAGGGRVASRRVERLIAAGASVRVVAPTVSDEVRAAAGAGRLEWLERRIGPADLADAALVLAATDDPATNRQVLNWAAHGNTLGSSVDDDAASTARFGASVVRDAVTIGVWTRATAPAVASWLAARVDRSLDDSTLLVAELATELRGELMAAGVTTDRVGWHRALDAGMLEAVRTGSRAELKEYLRACLSSS